MRYKVRVCCNRTTYRYGKQTAFRWVETTGGCAPRGTPIHDQDNDKRVLADSAITTKEQVAAAVSGVQKVQNDLKVK